MELLANIKPREYQEQITETCLEKNCLVVLPTGLGKTLIALMVAIKRLELFPTSKILMLAPTRPLAEQHLEYFKKNLPELYADIQLFTGTLKAEKRKDIWKTADIIFSTPQCIANDLKKKLYDLKEVSLLIEDEAHRCVKNYDYNYVARRYLEQAKNVRLIGLTASPGSDPRKIKDICKNLSIEEVELRTRESEDVKGYLQELEFDKIMVPFPPEFQEIKQLLKQIYQEYIDNLRINNFLFGPDNKIALIQLQTKLGDQIKRNYKSPSSYAAMSNCAQAVKLSHAIELLETQTLKSFTNYLREIYSQAEKKQSRGVVALVQKHAFNVAFAYANKLLEDSVEHPKIKELTKIVKIEISKHPKAKILIFTQFRETAKIISEELDKIKEITSQVFIGQTKKNGTGLTQKEQKKAIDDFKDSQTNILCATCIAEEGLDIPEVNLVVFYEPVSSAIRSIQRRGRTARLSKGKLIILITEKTKDEFSYYASRSKEKKMHTSIETVKRDLRNKFKEKQLELN
jgi:Fanconi anemia group M protein